MKGFPTETSRLASEIAEDLQRVNGDREQRRDSGSRNNEPRHEDAESHLKEGESPGKTGMPFRKCLPGASLKRREDQGR